jgi:hypothetical protein
MERQGGKRFGNANLNRPKQQYTAENQGQQQADQFQYVTPRSTGNQQKFSNGGPASQAQHPRGNPHMYEQTSFQMSGYPQNGYLRPGNYPAYNAITGSPCLDSGRGYQQRLRPGKFPITRKWSSSPLTKASLPQNYTGSVIQEAQLVDHLGNARTLVQSPEDPVSTAPEDELRAANDYSNMVYSPANPVQYALPVADNSQLQIQQDQLLAMKIQQEEEQVASIQMQQGGKKKQRPPNTYAEAFPPLLPPPSLRRGENINATGPSDLVHSAKKMEQGFETPIPPGPIQQSEKQQTVVSPPECLKYATNTHEFQQTEEENGTKSAAYSKTKLDVSETKSFTNEIELPASEQKLSATLAQEESITEEQIYVPNELLGSDDETFYSDNEGLSTSASAQNAEGHKNISAQNPGTPICKLDVGDSQQIYKEQVRGYESQVDKQSVPVFSTPSAVHPTNLVQNGINETGQERPAQVVINKPQDYPKAQEVYKPEYTERPMEPVTSASAGNTQMATNDVLRQAEEWVHVLLEVDQARRLAHDVTEQWGKLGDLGIQLEESFSKLEKLDTKGLPLIHQNVASGMEALKSSMNTGLAAFKALLHRYGPNSAMGRSAVFMELPGVSIVVYNWKTFNF